MFISFLKRCDYIGVTPRIYYKGHFRYRTASGGILSILLSFFFILLSVYFSYIFFSKNSFTVYENTVSIEKASKIWNKYDFSIILLDKYFQEIENSSQIYSIYADIWTDTRYYDNNVLKSKTVIVPVPIEKCNISSYEKEKEELWKNEKLINCSYCFSQEAINDKINSTGSYGETGYTGIVFWISLCTNNSLKNDCYPFEESKKILDNVFIYVKVLDYYFVHNNRNNYIIPYIKSDLIQASASIYKRQWYLFQEIEYVTDDGEIFRRDRKKNLQVFSSFYNSVDQRESPTIEKSFFALSLNMEGSKRIIKKQYYKLQDLFSNVNGFFQIIYLFVLVLNYVYCFTKMNEQIINDNINNYMEYSEHNLFISNNISMNGSNLNLQNLNMGNKNVNYENSKNNSNTVVFSGKNRRNCFTFSPIKVDKKDKLFIKDTSNTDNNIINYKKIIEILEKKNSKKKFKLSFLQASNPYLFFCPYIFFSSKNKTIKNFAYFEELILRQCEINNILHKLNFIDKFELAFLLNKKNRFLFNNCFNPKVKFYLNSLTDDKDETLNLDSDSIDNQEYIILKDILSNEINEKIANISSSW